MNSFSKSTQPTSIFFALLPFSVYVITAVLRKLGVISSRNDTVLIFNSILFLIAVGAFFFAGLPSKAENDTRLWGLLANFATPLAAFLMNTSAFGLAIRREVLWKDLWNWHMGWIICAVLQILILTDLGSGLLDLARAFLTWVKSIGGLLGRGISDILDAMNNANKSARLTVFAGLVTWTVYIGIQIYSEGVSNIFNVDFILTSTWLWIAVFVVCILIHLVKPIWEKSEESVRNSSANKLWIAIGVLVFIIVAGFLPSLLQALATLF